MDDLFDYRVSSMLWSKLPIMETSRCQPRCQSSSILGLEFIRIYRQLFNLNTGEIDFIAIQPLNIFSRRLKKCWKMFEKGRNFDFIYPKFQNF